jgi:aryl-alcohol dehydrogenase-like predicted oxidoreductase
MAAAMGRSPATTALNWVLCRPWVTAALIGCRTEAQLLENAGCLGWALDDEPLRSLETASAIDLGYPHDYQELVTRAFSVRGLDE